jgi:aromatase
MTDTLREVEHEITSAAPPETVYRLLADVTDWPRIFAPTIYAEQLETDGGSERIQIWATANGEAKNWTSRREFDPAHRRIRFRQEVSSPPVAEMSGTWVIEPAGDGGSRIRLLHGFRAIGDDPAGLDWIDRAVDRNSGLELTALKTNVERAHAAADHTFSFEDTVRIAGSVKDVYDFVNEAGRWTERLPHVARVRVTEETPGLQTLEMDTRAKDGSTHTTKSYRVCLPPYRIAYKQVTLPALMTLHTGIWTFAQDGDAVTATSQHTVELNTANIAKVLGDEATVEDARAYVRDALGTNSRATLGYAKQYAENGR